MIRHECGYFSTELFFVFFMCSKHEWQKNSCMDLLFSCFYMRESTVMIFPSCVTGSVLPRLNACTGFFLSCHDMGQIGSISGSLVILCYAGSRGIQCTGHSHAGNLPLLHTPSMYGVLYMESTRIHILTSLYISKL